VSRLAYRHQRVQALRRLVGRRSARRDQGRFVIEGSNLLEEALSSQAQIEAVYLDGEWAEAVLPSGRAAAPERSSGQDRLASLVDRSLERGARVFELEAGVLARVAGTVTPQPVMAVVQAPVYRLADIKAKSPVLVVVCVDVRDPGNAGTVVRSARAAGADCVVCCEGTVDLWNPKAVRSSAGAVLHLPVVNAGTAIEALDEIGGWGLRRLGAVSKGGEDYASSELGVPVALVLGNEAGGLPVAQLGDHLDGLVSIPMAGGAESLNVGMAAAVLCFEAARQSRLGSPPCVGTGREPRQDGERDAQGHRSGRAVGR
jgi:TrmH family RNA methyltransferase